MGGHQRSTYTLLLCFVIVQFTIGVIGSLDSRISILEVLFGNVIKGNIDSIKTRLDNLEKKENYSDNGVNETVLKDKLQEIVDNVNTKTKRMLAAFSVEKENFRNFEKSIVGEVKEIDQQFLTIDKRVDGLNVRVQGIDKYCNETNDHAGLIDIQIEVIDNLIGNIIQQVDNTSVKVDSIGLQVGNMDNQVGGINNSLNDIYKQLNDIVNQIKDNAEKIQDINGVITAMKTDMASLKQNVKAVEKKCPQGWKRQLNSCILYVRESVNWSDAKNYCGRKGANLFEPISHYALQLLTEELQSSGDRWWWVGASDRDNEGKWIWESSGKRIGNVNWHPGEPNNHGGHEDCMELIYESTLNDVDCNHMAYIICEIKLQRN